MSSSPSTINVKNINGVLLKSDINNLNNSSTTSDISKVFGSLEDIKNLIKQINDGNIFYTKHIITGMTNSYSYIPLGISISTDGSKYYILVSGVQGEGFSLYFNMGYLYIDYDIASNTYTCQKFNTSIS